MYETPEMKWLGGAPAVAEQSTEASRCRGPSAFPLRGDELQVPAPFPPAPAAPPPAVSLFLSGLEQLTHTMLLKIWAASSGILLILLLKTWAVCKCPHFSCSLQER